MKAGVVDEGGGEGDVVDGKAGGVEDGAVHHVRRYAAGGLREARIRRRTSR